MKCKGKPSLFNTELTLYFPKIVQRIRIMLRYNHFKNNNKNRLAYQPKILNLFKDGDRVIFLIPGQLGSLLKVFCNFCGNSIVGKLSVSTVFFSNEILSNSFLIKVSFKQWNYRFAERLFDVKMISKWNNRSGFFR